jgi:hypothetical protein
MSVLLGGDANPLGAVVQYVRAPTEVVVAALGDRFVVEQVADDLVASLPRLLPFESPWSRLLVAPCGDWTAVVNNGLYGGDNTAPTPAISRKLDAECVVASSVSRYGPGHEQTQFELFGPGGEPPLMQVRSLSASATDGRWEWHESGRPLPFEQVDRYAAKRVRARFDRDMLLAYLDALGIPANDDGAYGAATLMQERATYDRRAMTLAEARADFA